MANGDGDERAGEATDPLERLAEEVARRRTGESGSFYEEAAEGRADVWERLSSGDQPEASGAIELESLQPTPSRTGRASYPSMVTLLIHEFITLLALVVGAGIYVGATQGLLAERLWLLSLPFAVVGLLGALPIVSRWLRIWEPDELR